MASAQREAVKRSRKRAIDLVEVERLAASGLSRRGISKKLHFSRSTYEEREDVLTAVENGEAAIECEIVNALMTKVRAGDTISTIYASKVICGFVEGAKKEPEIDPDKSVVIYVPSNGR